MTTTTTTTVPSEIVDLPDNLTVVVFSSGIIVGAIVLFFIVRMLVTIANLIRPVEVIVIVLIALVTLVAIVAYAMTELDDLGVLAGTGLGAMAGAVTALYSSHNKKENDDGPSKPDGE